MSYKAFRGLRILVIIFVLLTMSIAITLENAILASFAVVIGIIAMLTIKRNVKEIKTDEMIQNIAQKSAWWAYNIFIPFLAILSIFLTVDNKEGSELYNLGVTLSYVALIHIALYLIAFLYLKKKYISDEKQN